MNKWLVSLESIVASNRVNPFDVLAPGGESHIKVTGMLVVSLRGVNCIFWFHLRCLVTERHYMCQEPVCAHSGVA